LSLGLPFYSPELMLKILRLGNGKLEYKNRITIFLYERPRHSLASHLAESKKHKHSFYFKELEN
jgi:hypothetical protein